MKTPTDSHLFKPQATSDFAEALMLKVEHLFNNPILPVHLIADTTTTSAREVSPFPKSTINTLFSPEILMLIFEYYVGSGYFNKDGPQCEACADMDLEDDDSDDDTDTRDCEEWCENRLYIPSPRLDELQRRYINTPVIVAEGHTTSPVILTHVCSTWRRLAVGMSSLWSEMSLIEVKPQSHLMVDNWLSRSQSHVPLVLRYIFNEMGDCEKLREAWKKAAKVLIDNRARIESLSVEVIDPTTFPWKYIFDPSKVFTRLRVLSVQQGG